MSRRNGPQSCYSVTIVHGRPEFHEREGLERDADGERVILAPPFGAVGTVYRPDWTSFAGRSPCQSWAWRVAGADRSTGFGDTRGRVGWALVRHVEALRREVHVPVHRPLELLSLEQFLRLVDVVGRLQDGDARLAKMREFASRRWPDRGDVHIATPQLSLFEQSRCA